MFGVKPVHSGLENDEPFAFATSGEIPEALHGPAIGNSSKDLVILQLWLPEPTTFDTTTPKVPSAPTVTV